MSPEEKQELRFLELIFTNNIERIDGITPQEIFRNEFKVGLSSLIGRMIGDGVLMAINNGYEVLPIAKDRYEYLKKLSSTEKINTLRNRILFVAAVVAAIYAVLTFYVGGCTNTKKSQKPALDTTQNIKPKGHNFQPIP